MRTRAGGQAGRPKSYVIMANGMYWGNRRSGWRSFHGFGDLRNAIRYPSHAAAEKTWLKINKSGRIVERPAARR